MSTQEPIGLLIAAVRRRIKQITAGPAEEHRLSPQQFWTVVAIARNEGLSLRELAERRRMDYPTASRVVGVLVRRRVVRNETDPADRRRSRLALTRTGQALARRLLPAAVSIAGTVESALTPSEREAVVIGLGKILSSLDRRVATEERRRMEPATPAKAPATT